MVKSSCVDGERRCESAVGRMRTANARMRRGFGRRLAPSRGYTMDGAAKTRGVRELFGDEIVLAT